VVKELRLVLTVDDFDQALAFYRDELGLEMQEMWVADGSRGVLLEAGRATLELFDEGQAAMVDELEVGRRVAGKVRVAFEVDASPEVADKLEAAGANRIAGPVETPWQSINVRLVAPDGTQLTLFSPADDG
jgi:catechol 2,3-dioxygenase-like lactoylglutathione lyase family enzyme